MKKNYFWIFIFSVFLAITVLMNLAGLYTDWLWYKSLKYQEVFIKIITTRIALGSALGAAFLAAMLINLFTADRLSRIGYIKVGPDAIELPGSETLGKHIRVVMISVSAFISLIIGIEGSSRWDMFLRFLNPTNFNLKDPILGKDISFFVFRLPFINYLYQWFFVVLIFSLILSICIYAYKRGLIITDRGVRFRTTLYSHISTLVALIFILKAFGYRIFLYNMQLSSRGFVSGAGYTDLHLRVPIISGLFIVCLICTGLFLANTYFRGWKLPAAAVLLFAVASGIGAGYPEIIQKLRVNPNELSMELPYIKRQIEFTRKAYGVDRVTVKPHATDLQLTADQIQANNLTIQNIRLWDSRPLLQTYRQLQEIRTYYGFNGVDMDRYIIDGKLRQVMLSARELSYEKLPSRTWINEHLSFTHGYGLCMTPVNMFTSEGLPEFFIKDIPPVNNTDFKIDMLQIYYGETMNDYVFVGTRADEFDYPVGEENKIADYTGKGGVPLDSIIKKAAFAIRFSSLAILLNTDITTDSRIMIYRNVISDTARIGLASKLMPLIEYDMDPYIVIDNGRIKWILDGYSLSGNFPYSQKFSVNNVATYNYIRNSVKAVVDAYDGTIDFYVFDENDPIIRTYRKIFPGLFHSENELPPTLRAHIRYPSDLFKVQSKILMSYHMTDPNVFYNKEDLWDYAREMFYQNEQEVEPYYTIMKLPDGEKEEYVLMMPFTPSNRTNMSAWMCARNDGAHYGNMIVYTFPKKKLVYGPRQIEARIDQDPEISKQFSLWNQGGSQIIRGNTLVIPIEKSFLYVEPIYLKAEKAEIPELKRVIVSIGNKVSMGDDLNSALVKILGVSVATNADRRKSDSRSAVEAGHSLETLIQKSLDHIEAAKQRLREFDWSGFGDHLDAAEKTLRSIRPAKPQKPKDDDSDY